MDYPPADRRRLRAAPARLAAGPESEAWRDVVLAMVRVIRSLNRSIGDLDRSVVAQLRDSREAYDGPEAVVALSGMAPVTRRSGKHLAVGFR